MMELSPLDRGIRAARRGHEIAARTLLDDVLAADPSNEEALLWRARVASGDAERADLLQRTLAVNPNNRWAAQQLQASGVSLQGGDGATSGGVGISPSARGLRGTPSTLQCPNCGGSVEVHPERGVKAAMCQYCGSVLDLGTQELDIIGQMNPKVKPKHGVRPGDEATFFGENHLVIGWLRYKGWDSEDSWKWEEWQMVSDGGTPRYLSYSPDEGWLVQTPIRPTPEITGKGLKLPDGFARAKEVGPAKIIAMQGELTWRPKLGKTLQVMEAAKGDRKYSAELTADELEVVGGEVISERELWTAFGREDKIREMEERAERRRRRRKSLRRAAVLCLLSAGAYFMGIGWAASKGGSVIASSSAEYVADFESITPLPPKENNTIERRDSVALGTVNIDDADAIYEVTTELKSDGNPPYPVVHTYVEEPDGDTHQLGRAFNKGDGTYSSSYTFNPNDTGTHRLIAYVDEGSPERLTISTTVRTGMWDPGPFATACGLSFLLGIVLFLAGGFGRID